MLQACILHNCMLRMNLFKYLVNQYGSKSSFAALFHIKLPQFLSKSNNRIPLSTAYKSLAKILNVDLSSIIYRVLQMLLPIFDSLVNSSSRGSPWLVNRNLINWVKPYTFVLVIFNSATKIIFTSCQWFSKWLWRWLKYFFIVAPWFYITMHVYS